MRTVLAVDDEPSIRKSYEVILDQDYHLLLAEDGQSALDILEKHHADLILLDLSMHGMKGEEFLRRFREHDSFTPVVVVTAANTVVSAVEMMKLGANDYILKPFGVEDITIVVEKLLSETQDKLELMSLRESELNGFESIIGSSPALMKTLHLAKQAMKVDSTVLITGENGTGKDLVARAIHSGGRRAEKAFMPLSCCAIAVQLFESELFGHVKGAFTDAHEDRIGKLQVADGGTIFLDEIGEMPMETQVKLLRVLQDSRFFPVGGHKEIEVDIRIVSATNRILTDAIKERIFREDLYFRLNVLNIEMPPLRNRREDIPELVTHFAAKHGPKVNAKTTQIDAKGMAMLATYHWPGNVRELENTVERLLVYYGKEKVIGSKHVEAILPDVSPRDVSGFAGDFEGLPLEEAVRRLEHQMISKALARANQVQTKAADLLGTTRRVLKYKIDQLGIASVEE